MTTLTHPAWCASHLDCTGTCFTTARTTAGVTVYAEADTGRPPLIHVSADMSHPTDLAGLADLIATLTRLHDDLTRSPR